MNSSFGFVEDCPFEDIPFKIKVKCDNSSECAFVWPCELKEFWSKNISPCSDILEGLLTYCTIVFIFVGIIFNGLSLWILLSTRIGKMGSGIYLLTLTVTDTGNLILNYGIGVSRHLFPGFNNLFLNSGCICRIHGMCVELFHMMSSWIIVCFTIERSFAVWFPITQRFSRTRRAKMVIFVVTTFSLIFCSSKLFVTGFETDSVFGYTPCKSNRYQFQILSYLNIAFQTWMPILIVFCSNSLTLCKLTSIKKLRKQLGSTITKRDAPNGTKQRANKNSKMLQIVSIAYLILGLPLGIVQTVEICWNVAYKIEYSEFEPERSGFIHWMKVKMVLKQIRIVFFIFYQLMFVIDFFLYSMTLEQFRMKAKNTLISRFTNKNPSEFSSSRELTHNGIHRLHNRKKNFSLEKSTSLNSTKSQVSQDFSISEAIRSTTDLTISKGGGG